MYRERGGGGGGGGGAHWGNNAICDRMQLLMLVKACNCYLMHTIFFRFHFHFRTRSVMRGDDMAGVEVGGYSWAMPPFAKSPPPPPLPGLLNCMCHTQSVVFKVILHTLSHRVFKHVEVILILNMTAKLLASAVSCRMCLHTNVLMGLRMPLSLSLTLH